MICVPPFKTSEARRQGEAFWTQFFCRTSARKANLACSTGVTPGHPIAPSIIDPADADAPWPAANLLARGAALTIGALDRRFEEIPSGAGDKPPSEAVVVPIARQGQDAPAGFLVAGINPYRRVGEAYLGFINLVSGQIASGLANAHAYEESVAAPRRSQKSIAQRPRSSRT
jgi:hypothetical protein